MATFQNNKIENEGKQEKASIFLIPYLRLCWQLKQASVQDFVDFMDVSRTAVYERLAQAIGHGLIWKKKTAEGAMMYGLTPIGEQSLDNHLKNPMKHETIIG